MQLVKVAIQAAEALNVGIDYRDLPYVHVMCLHATLCIYATARVQLINIVLRMLRKREVLS